MSSPDPDRLPDPPPRDQSGPGGPSDDKVKRLYDGLRQVARMMVTGASIRLDATDLANETWIRRIDPLLRSGTLPEQFWQIYLFVKETLLDLVRHEKAVKRGGGRCWSLPLDDGLIDFPAELREADVEALHRAIDVLHADHPRAAEVVVLRCFGGLGNREVAAALGCSEATIDRDWRFAKAWFRTRLGGQHGPPDAGPEQ